MNVSLDSNYFTAQMKTKGDQEFFHEYYNHFQIHLEHAKKYIDLKRNFNNYLKNKIENNILTYNELEVYHKLYKELEYSIKLIEKDAKEYKEKFKHHLFYLIKK
jgi:N-glycosylase/DNA lyase